MRTEWISLIIASISIGILGCRQGYNLDGPQIEMQLLTEYNISKDHASLSILEGIIKDINCADSAELGKRIVLAGQYHSADTNEILLIPYMANEHILRSYAYSDVANRILLINPQYIRDFTLQNTLSDTASFIPVLELMLLHEVGHFILGTSGDYDRLNSATTVNNLQPEYITSIKKVELAADSIAIALVKRKLSNNISSCLNIAFDVERILPGMQFQLAGKRLIENFGSSGPVFLHDPSDSHPNLELRVAFMNYFLFPNNDLRTMIEEYLYNRTVAPIHAQEFAPMIYQGQKKELSDQ